MNEELEALRHEVGQLWAHIEQLKRDLHWEVNGLSRDIDSVKNDVYDIERRLP